MSSDFFIFIFMRKALPSLWMTRDALAAQMKGPAASIKNSLAKLNGYKKWHFSAFSAGILSDLYSRIGEIDIRSKSRPEIPSSWCQVNAGKRAAN
ncbi:hypothetical protein ATU3B_09580 [Agrobacterium genomosp. 3 str. CIP 111-78]|uniref:Uncharacterized protein n=1 Tax=Agrobacterium tumefaciens TaxID=358 RepID=A0AAE6EMC6_AGRTU|nr:MULTISPECIES: hypothetical protein [Agrobacterium tumefaciens complex]MBP8937776.1 hypothetical protein [Agrobacterium sp.]MCA2371866.1 hypothetical protein [Agrobacterium tomkonis CIP 111-78]QCM02359.1 hypothetical protein CFBP6624_19390 [Agrobacterium tumefaciens]